MNVGVSVDISELQKAFAEYLAYSKRSVPKIMVKQATQLCVGAKGVKGLFQEARGTARATRAAIRQLPRKLGYRIKRSGGRTVKQEIAARQVNAGIFQASGWLPLGLPISRGRFARVKTEGGFVTVSGAGSRYSITLHNTRPGALEFATRTGYMQRAVSARARDMRFYVQKKLASDAAEFSRKRPRFSGKSIEQQLDAIMGK